MIRLHRSVCVASAIAIVAACSEAACDPAKGGWYYDDAVLPKTVTLCPSSCSTVTADVTGQVNIEVGCKTITTQ